MSQRSAIRRTNVGQVCLTLNVTYTLNGERVEHLKGLLENGIQRAIGDGLLTGHAAAEVDVYSVDAAVIEDALDLKTLTRLTALRIESGALALEDIPKRLAQYGLMSPGAFVAEMRERLITEGERSRA